MFQWRCLSERKREKIWCHIRLNWHHFKMTVPIQAWLGTVLTPVLSLPPPPLLASQVGGAKMAKEERRQERNRECKQRESSKWTMTSLQVTEGGKELRDTERQAEDRWELAWRCRHSEKRENGKREAVRGAKKREMLLVRITPLQPVYH